MRRISSLLFAIFLLFFCVISASAHSGRTDGQGGHRDNKNKSGLGSYHYHHGYSAHLHQGGICPYAPKDTIAISNLPQSLCVGESLSLEWTVTYYSGSSSVAWTSNAPDIIDVTDGCLTAKAPGEATITATLANGSKSFTVSSKEVLPDDISITAPPARLELAKSVPLTVSFSPANVTNQAVVWSTSDTGVATVSETGVLSGVSPGTATVTVSCASGLSRSFELEVYARAPERVSVSDSSLRLAPGGSFSLTADVEPADTTDPSLQWTSLNPDIASVDQSGLVTAHKAGQAVIRVSCQAVSSDISVDVQEDVPAAGAAAPPAAPNADSTPTDTPVESQSSAGAFLGILGLSAAALLAAVGKQRYDSRKRQAAQPPQRPSDAAKRWHYRTK